MSNPRTPKPHADRTNRTHADDEALSGGWRAMYDALDVPQPDTGPAGGEP